MTTMTNEQLSDAAAHCTTHFHSCDCREWETRKALTNAIRLLLAIKPMLAYGGDLSQAVDRQLLELRLRIEA